MLRRRSAPRSAWDWSPVARRSWDSYAALFRKWHAAGRLFIAGGPSEDCQRATVFNGVRNAVFDRALQDQRGINGLEQVLPDRPASRLPAGPLTCDIILDYCHVLRASSADLSHMYDTLAVSRRRARRNRCGPSRPIDDFEPFRGAPTDVPSLFKDEVPSLFAAQDLDSFAVALEARGARRRAAAGDDLQRAPSGPDDTPEHLFPQAVPLRPTVASGAFFAAAQGDHLCVDFAQSFHVNCCAAAGSMLPARTIASKNARP